MRQKRYSHCWFICYSHEAVVYPTAAFRMMWCIIQLLFAWGCGVSYSCCLHEVVVNSAAAVYMRLWCILQLLFAWGCGVSYSCCSHEVVYPTAAHEVVVYTTPVFLSSNTSHHVTTTVTVAQWCCGAVARWLSGAVAQWLEHWTQSREPVFESSCCYFKAWTISVTPHCPSSLYGYRQWWICEWLVFVQ